MDERTYLQGILDEIEYWKQVLDDLRKLNDKVQEIGVEYTEIHHGLILEQIRVHIEGSSTHVNVLDKLEDATIMDQLLGVSEILNELVRLMLGRLTALHNVVKGINEEDEE